MSEAHLLELRQIDAAYGPVKALRRVSLHVDAGEIVTLIGANGAGKSTLLMTIFGEPRASHGRIAFDGRDITEVATHEVAKLCIALVPEGRRIFGGMTVEENLLMGTVCLGAVHVEPDLIKVFEMFPRLKERFGQRAGTLSGGEQQMLAIARALMGRPRLLLLDEPSLGLAPLMVRQIFENLAEIAAAGTTVFLVEQNANHALRLAGRGYVLVNGEIRLSGTGSELLHNPEVRKAYLGGH